MANTRLVVELNELSQAAILRRSVKEGLNKTTITNRALQVYDLIQEEVAKGWTVVLRDSTGDYETTLKII